MERKSDDREEKLIFLQMECKGFLILKLYCIVNKKNINI